MDLPGHPRTKIHTIISQLVINFSILQIQIDQLDGNFSSIKLAYSKKIHSHVKL